MKNNLPLNLIKAENKATEIIEKFGITSPEHIQLEDIAFALGARVIEGSLHGAAASLVRNGKFATIRITTDESYPGRKRFSIAHELGHFILKHGHSLYLICTEDNMMDWYQKSGQETEANTFAAELILPIHLIKDRCDVKEVNFKPILQIAQDFNTSLTATAIRFVRFCPEKCALVFSKNSQIQWFYKSDDWWPYIRKGDLDINTFAANFYRGLEVPNEPLEVDGCSWLDDSRLDSIIEHSICSHRLGYVISILWIKS